MARKGARSDAIDLEQALDADDDPDDGAVSQSGLSARQSKFVMATLQEALESLDCDEYDDSDDSDEASF